MSHVNREHVTFSLKKTWKGKTNSKQVAKKNNKNDNRNIETENWTIEEEIN